MHVLNLIALYYILYCDMTPERRKCTVRKATQRRPLLDNGWLGTFPQQRMSTRITDELFEMAIFIWFVPDL
jgi:hypothetical protein